MRLFRTSIAILLALVAFVPTSAMAKGPGGGQGQPGGGQQRGGRESIGQPTGGQKSIERQGTGDAATRDQAGPNLGRTEDAGAGAPQNPGPLGHPQFSGGAGGAATADDWRYRSDNGRWWYYTPQNRWMLYGADGQWTGYRADGYADPANAYTVQRPILANPAAEASFSGGPIRIVNPAANKATLNYTLDGVAYTIAPGYSQELREDRDWVIRFSRGASLEQAQYGLRSGLYSFTSTEHGWELYRTELP
jgi:hypothetical protein